MYLPMQVDEIGQNQNKSINETSVSSISTDWSLQSISIKSDSPIFIDRLLRGQSRYTDTVLIVNIAPIVIMSDFYQYEV